MANRDFGQNSHQKFRKCKVSDKRFTFWWVIMCVCVCVHKPQKPSSFLGNFLKLHDTFALENFRIRQEMKNRWVNLRFYFIILIGWIIDLGGCGAFKNGSNPKKVQRIEVSLPRTSPNPLSEIPFCQMPKTILMFQTKSAATQAFHWEARTGTPWNQVGAININ